MPVYPRIGIEGRTSSEKPDPGHTCPVSIDDELTPEERTLTDRGRQAARLHIVDGYLVAFERLDDIGQAVRRCRSRSQAVATLTAPPFGFSDAQAHHILDLSFAHQTEERRLALVAEGDDLRRRLGAPGAAPEKT
jgi:DNA gyrase subunit A